MPDTMISTEAPAYRNRSADIKDLAAALVKTQAALEGAKKDAKAVITGSQTRTYADLASVWEAVRKPLTDNGLCVVQFPRSAGQGVEIETTLLHGATGQFMSDVLWVPCGKNDAQGLGSAITYGRRYALMAVVGVCPVDDDGAAAVSSHKSGPVGMANAGTDFLPPGPRRSTNWVDESRNDGTLDESRPKGTLPGKAPAPGKKSAAEKAKEWTDRAIATINLPGQHVESLDRWWKDQEKIPDGAKFSPLGWLEEAAPGEHDRLQTEFDRVRSAAKLVQA